MIKSIYHFMKKIKPLRRVVIIAKQYYYGYKLNKFGMKIMNDLNTAFYGHNNSIFIPAYGALLGLYRDGRFIRHDSDLDLFYLSDIKSFNFKNFDIVRIKISDSFSNRVGNFEYIENHNKVKLEIDGVNVDIYVALNQDNSGWTSLEHNIQIHSLTKLKVMCHEILIPSNTEQIINKLYGDGWRIPDRTPYSYRGKWPFD